MNLSDVSRVFGCYDNIVESAGYPIENIEKWSSADDQQLIRENWKLLAKESESHFPVEGGRLTAGLIHYLESAL